MAFKFVFAFALVAVASAGLAPVYQAPHAVYHAAAPVAVHAAPVGVAHKVLVKSEEYDSHPQYRFTYGVDDKLTGDSKSQVEERDGDVVRGEYSLIDADGYKRTVQYTSDPHNGFNAVVHREPLVKAVAVAPVAVKSYAAPTYVKSVAPVAHYAAPTYTSYAAPAVVKTVAPSAYYAAPAVVKAVSPVAYTSYAAPAPAVVKTAYTAPTHYTSYGAPAAAYYHH